VISRKDIESLYEKHVLHSLSIAAEFDFTDGMEIIDIGTGGGFPGIPLAIFFPKVKFHLVDSIGKKLKVVESIAREIHLNNITAEQIRAEKLKDAPQRPARKFNFAVSRAVAPLRELWKWSKPLLKEGSTNDFPTGLICLKGGDLSREIAQSGARPKITEIFEIFPEQFFKEKYILYVS
jgi:16S rRNA (guanine527-N7)-methyltransferase